MGSKDSGAAFDATAQPLENFSFFDNEVQSDPYEFYRTLHAKCPVYKVPDKDLYILSKYEDPDKAIRNSEGFLVQHAICRGES